MLLALASRYHVSMEDSKVSSPTSSTAFALGLHVFGLYHHSIGLNSVLSVVHSWWTGSQLGKSNGTNLKAMREAD